jgi:hypothetical protein
MEVRPAEWAGEPEPVFVIVYGAQESIPRNQFCQPMWLGGPVRKIGLSYWTARLGIDYWAPQMVYKYGLWLHRLAEFIPGSHKRLKIRDLF